MEIIHRKEANYESKNRVIVRMVINIHENNSMSVEYPAGDLAYHLSILDCAREAIKNHFGAKNGKLVVPSKDLSI